jgi:hypothetical protein
MLNINADASDNDSPTHVLSQPMKLFALFLSYLPPTRGGMVDLYLRVSLLDQHP